MPKEENVDNRFIGKHFQIKYNKKDDEYYLKDLGHGFGTFVKIINWIEIKNNFLLSIGENYIVITLGNPYARIPCRSDYRPQDRA